MIQAKRARRQKGLREAGRAVGPREPRAAEGAAGGGAAGAGGQASSSLSSGRAGCFSVRTANTSLFSTRRHVAL